MNSLEGVLYQVVRRWVRFLFRLTLAGALELIHGLWIEFDPNIVQLLESFFSWMEKSIMDDFSVSPGVI